MKYTYAYKTSDGVRHEESMDAPTRESVFETLRAQGIKAIKVVAADGSKANGEAKEEGKRKKEKVWYASAAALFALFALFAFFVFFVAKKDTPPSSPEVASTPRHQIYGDPALMQELYEDGFARVFDDATDRYIAYFAQPGVVPDERLLAKLRPFILSKSAGRDLKATGRDQKLDTVESREIRELREIVAGMRDEMRAFMADGSSLVDYLNALSERQREENSIYERVSAELEGERDESVREKKNAALRALGLRTVPRPKSRR